MELYCLSLEIPSPIGMFSLVMRETTLVKPPTNMEMPLRQATLKLTVRTNNVWSYEEIIPVVSVLTYICLHSIAEKPTASLPSNPPTLFVGDTLTLTCSVAGDPQPTISWSKDGTSLSETTKTFTKHNVQLGDEGRYSCKATNKHGSATATSNVIVDATSIVIVDSKDIEFVLLRIDRLCCCRIIILFAFNFRKTNSFHYSQNTNPSCWR